MGRLLPLGEPEAEATPSGLRSPPDFPFGSSTSPSLTLAGQEQRGQLGEGGGHVCDPTVVTGPHPEPWHRGCPWHRRVQGNAHGGGGRTEMERILPPCLGTMRGPQAPPAARPPHNP